MRIEKIKLSKHGSASLEIAFYSFFLLTMILSSLKINRELIKKNVLKVKDFLNESNKN